MKNFILQNPTKIIFGQGQIKRIGLEVKRFGSKALLVYGKESIKKNGVYEQVVTSMHDAGIGFVELSGVRSNPVLSHVRKGISLAREEDVQVVLAVGGGSVIDTAKAIAAGVKADHDVWEFFTFEKTIQDALPVLTVVTISASASEMNTAAPSLPTRTAHINSVPVHRSFSLGHLSWFSSIGSPVSLHEGGISESDIGRIAANACPLAQAWGLKEYGQEVVTDILMLCR